MAYSTISLVVLETAPHGHEGAATASMGLASVLGSALGTGLGGAIIGIAVARGSFPATDVAIVDCVVAAITAFAILPDVRLPGRTLPSPPMSRSLPSPPTRDSPNSLPHAGALPQETIKETLL